MNEIDDRVNRHYGWSGLMQTIEQEIRRNGIDPARVTVDDLAPVDNYHWHRLAGTLALARAARIATEDTVLDVGGGIGGPAWVTGEELDAELDRANPRADDASSHPTLNPGLLNGPDGPQMGANVGRNSAEGRILPALGVYERI